MLTKTSQDIFVIESKTEKQVCRKDLEKFLGVPVTKNCSNNKKDLSSFLGINRNELDRVVSTCSRDKIDSSVGTREHYFVSESEFGDMSTSTSGSSSTDSSSLWSSF